MKNLIKRFFKQAVSLTLGGATTGFCLTKTDLSETESILAGAGVYMISATTLDTIINTDPINPYKEAVQNLHDTYNDYMEDDEDEELIIPCVNDDDDDDDDEEEDSESDQQTGKENVNNDIQTPIEVMPKTNKDSPGNNSKVDKKIHEEFNTKGIENEFKKELEKEIDKLFRESSQRKPSMTEEEFSNMTKETPVTENGIHWSQPKHTDNDVQDLGIYEDYESRPRKKQKKAKANNHLHKEVSKKKVDKALAG